MALHGAKGEILSRENGPLFRTGAKGERRARRGTKGGILFSKRIPPLNPPEKGKGRPLRPRLHWQSVARRAARAAQSGAVYMASP